MAEIGQVLVDLTWLWTSCLGGVLAVSVFWRAVKGDDWAPILVMATVPIQRALLVGHGGLHVTWTQAVLAAFFAGALIRFAAGTLRVRVDGIAIAMGAIVCLYGLSVIVAGEARLWAAETYRWAVTGAFLILARTYFRPQSSRRILGALVTGAAVLGTWAAIQVIGGEGPSSFVRSGLLRAYGAFGEPNPFAACVWAVTLPLIAFVVFGSSTQKVWRWLSAIGTMGGLATLTLTQSRGGFLGVAAGLCLIAGMVLLDQRPRVRVAGLALASLGAAFVIALIIHLAPWAETGAATSPANWADQERAAHWAAAINMVTDHPFLGVGAGQFSDHYRIATQFWRFRISRGHAHNAYLQVAAEIGLPGMLAYALLLSALLGSLIRRIRTTRDNWLAVGVAAMTTALLVHQMVDYLHVLSLGLLFAGLWAAALPSTSKGNSSREHDFAA